MSAPLAPYRRLFAVPGSSAFCGLGVVARLPMSMLGLGVVLLVSGRTGSYALAGSVSAAYVLAAAVVAPLLSRLIDRHGQRRVLQSAVLVNAAAMLALVAGMTGGGAAAHSPVPQVLAALGGASFPPVGSAVRARWIRLLGLSPRLQTAFALEAMLDEAVFVVGPVAVTTAATLASPALAVVFAVVIGVVGTWLFAGQRRTEPGPMPVAKGAPKAPLNWRLMGPLVVASGALGALFGSAEVSVVALAAEGGHASAAGATLAFWSAGSGIAAAWLGAHTPRRGAARRFLIGSAVLTSTLVVLPFVPNLVVLAGVFLLAGLSISPTLVASMGLVTEWVPTSRVTEGMGWTSTGMCAGVAAGAAVAGPLLDAYGGHAGFWVSLAAGLLCTVLAAGIAKLAAGMPAGPTEPTDPIDAGPIDTVDARPATASIPV
jgi:MFS family permease